nr:MFS transporter [Paraburkholderia phenoliruptrix]
MAADQLYQSDYDRRLFVKISRRIVLILFVCYVISFLDRINIGFAQLQMKRDLGFSDAMYGLGASVFYVGYVLFEVPSNILLVRFGARKTFSRIMFLWGLTSASMAFVSQPEHFYVLRLLLGVFEAGFFPGIVVYLSYWFPGSRRATVMAVFFAGVALAGVLGGVVSGSIMHYMDGIMELYGWQWMFVLEGIPAVLLAFAVRLSLVDKPHDANWLTQAQKDRVAELCEAKQSEVQVHGVRGVMRAVLNPFIYMFSFVYFSLSCAALALNFWIPLIIRDFGINDVVSISLCSAIPNAIGAVGLLVIANLSDRTGERRGYFGLCTTGGGAALFALTLHSNNFYTMLAILSIATLLIFAALPIFWAVSPAYLTGSGEAVGVALVSSVGMLSGIVSPWAIGRIRTSTGSMDIALYILSGMLMLSGIGLAAIVKKTKNL